MDGSYHKKVQQWADKQIDKVKEGLIYDSYHIDEILDHVPKEDWVDKAKGVFTILVQRVKERDPDRIVLPMVVFPLISKWKNLQMNPPQNMEEFTHLIDGITPPEIYINNISTYYRFKPHEEYQCPINFSIMNEPFQYYEYYREIKFIEGIRNDWEFARGIYIEYYPNGLHS